MKKLILVILFSLTYFLGLSQPGIDSLKKLLAVAKTDSSRTRITIDLSKAFFSINLDSAIYYARQGVERARSFHDSGNELESQLTLADALSERDIPQSMQVYYQALQLAEKNNDRIAMGDCYKAIGLLHLYLGNGDLYADYLQKAIIVYNEVNAVSLVAGCYAEIGGVYVESKQDSARYYLNLAAKDSFNQRSPYYAYYWARLESNDNPQKARAFFKQSLQLSNDHANLRAQSLANRWLSMFYQKQGQTDSAIIAARNGLVAAQQLNFLRGIMNNSAQLTSLYKNLNQTDSAYKYMGIMIVAKDSLLSPEKINQIQNAIITEQQRVQKLQLEKKSLQDRIKLYASLAIGLVLLLFALFFYRNQRRIQRSNKLLQVQSEEISKKRAELQQSFDTLKTTQAQLIQSEKMASLGELTAGIAHEIQNPLNFVNNFSEVNIELLAEMNEEIGKGNFTEVI
ncbi:MAG: hypothetical protein ABIN01_13745, partial [Ferruginibacter sp.]